MRLLSLGLVLVLTAAELGAQTPGLSWNPAPSEAEASARSLGKPLVLLWQAGPGAVEFTQGVERLFSNWPEWSRQAALVAVFARARAWEAPLPPSFPALPEGGKVSALVVWNPWSPRPPSVWTAVPPVLELSRKVAESAGRALADPYNIDVLEYSWEGGALVRVDKGPSWLGSSAEGSSRWTEEGPVGTVLVLTEADTGRRVAFPLEGDWSFLYNAGAQSWTPWNPILVKRR